MIKNLCHLTAHTEPGTKVVGTPLVFQDRFDHLKDLPRTGRKEGNVLFNDALDTFYLRLYRVRHMVKNHSDSEKGNATASLNKTCPSFLPTQSGF